MSIRNGVWLNAAICKPQDDQLVLCVKQTKNGTRDYCFGRWHGPNEYYPDGHWTTSGSCSNIVLWMPLPRIP